MLSLPIDEILPAVAAAARVAAQRDSLTAKAASQGEFSISIQRRRPDVDGIPDERDTFPSSLIRLESP